ncbi:transglutaminase superfamily protein [Paramicrobacterium agarici]|uniref:Transglutaminase superfamily protein n=1 Tax=Paramicrobacterium agarici TaxID=630514 RepID=A0A2A9DUT5_9MICO|nr:transglutaminase superfamily protein [Microbacterium agarici]
MPLRHRVRTVLAYPPHRWVDLAIATVRAARVESALRRGGVERAARIGHVRVVMDGDAAPTASLDDAGLTPRDREKLDTAWRLLRQSPFNGTCLRRAIVGGSFLRSRDPILRIGVSKTDGVVAAHAWLEVNGVALDPDGSDRYAVLTVPTKGA